MTFSKDLKPKGEGGTLYTSRDLATMQAEINALKAATAQLENQLADMADLTNTTVLRANAVQTHDLSANLAVLGTAVVEGELAVSNGSGNDKDVIVNRNGVPEWGTPTDINAVNVLVTDTVERATTVDHTGTVNEAESVQNVDQCETVGEAQTVTQADGVTHADVVTEVDTIAQVDSVSNATTVTNAQAVTNADNVAQADKVAHADLVQVADVIQQTGDAQIVGNLDVTGSITQAGYTLDSTYIKLTEKGASNGVATLDNTGRVPASQLTIDAMEYKGKWDADTNTPTLADGAGTDGDFYIVSVAGTQDLGGGSISFNVNDSVMYNGSRWERIPAGQVDSVNGQTGEVNLTGLDIPESPTDTLPIDRRLKNWLYVDGQGASATKTVRGYYSSDGIALITFDTDNVYQGALYLTINGTTNKVWLNANSSGTGNWSIPKGTYIIHSETISSVNYWVIEKKYVASSSRNSLNAENSHLANLLAYGHTATETGGVLTVNNSVSVLRGTTIKVYINSTATNRASTVKLNGTSYTVDSVPLNSSVTMNNLNFMNALAAGSVYDIIVTGSSSVTIKPAAEVVESYSDGYSNNFIAYSNGILIQWGVWSDLPEVNHLSENFRNFPAVFANTNYAFFQSRQFWNGSTETPLACDNNLSKDATGSFNPKRTNGIYIAGWHNPVSWLAVGRWK